jgi:hypothetical protein
MGASREARGQRQGKTKISRMLKVIYCNRPPQTRQDAPLPVPRPQGKSTPQAYALGYVEDIDQPGAKLGKKRVLARLGWVGVKGPFSASCYPTS